MYAKCMHVLRICTDTAKSLTRSLNQSMKQPIQTLTYATRDFMATRAVCASRILHVPADPRRVPLGERPPAAEDAAQEGVGGAVDEPRHHPAVALLLDLVTRGRASHITSRSARTRARVCVIQCACMTTQ